MFRTRYHAVPTRDGRLIEVKMNNGTQEYGPKIHVEIEEWEEFVRMINSLDITELKENRKKYLLNEQAQLQSVIDRL